MRRQVSIALAVLAALAAGGWLVAEAPAAGPFEVPLTVQESAGVARKAEPVSGGVPLPPGRFRAGQPFCLLDAAGRQIPCQVTPLVVHTDGTLRWVLLDFADDVPAGATKRYLLRAGKPAARFARPLAVRQTDAEVGVETGAIRFAVSKAKPFALFAAASAGGKPVVTGGEVAYTQLHGRSGWDDSAKWQARTFRAAAPDRVAVHYAGPQRVTVEVAGRFGGDPLGAGYQAYLTAWAGSSRVHVKLKIRNSNRDRYTVIPVKGARVVLRLAGRGEKVLLGADRPFEAGREAYLHQGLELRAGRGSGVAGPGGDEKLPRPIGAPGRPPGGWIARLGAPNVFVCDRLFSSNPARRLAVEDGGATLVLGPIAACFEARKDNRGRPIGRPRTAEGFWLFDCSHHSSEYLFDFAPAANAKALGDLAAAGRNRLWVLAPGAYYSACEAVGAGRFGTLADEKACYDKWGWTYEARQVPDRPKALPDAFVAREDNHYESEADSVEGLLMMYLRTGQRGWFDLAEAWARYHMDLQAWRTDGWRWKDGAIWFPSGGPQGNRPVRTKYAFGWGPSWGNRSRSVDCIDLWRLSMAKSCYCHFYGAGLADYYCLTGDRDALEAAIDDVEQKDNEFRRHQKYEPGKTAVGSIRGFGRGFHVILRVLEVDPGNERIAELARLCAQTLWQSPLMDERGFHCSRIGGGWAGMKAKSLTPGIRKWMADNGITFTQQGDSVDTLSKGGKTWKVHCYGGTWQHVYIQSGADLYARHFDDEDMRDFTIAFAQMCSTYMRSRKCHQTWYYTYFDVPDLGRVFDPWIFDHADTTDGEGCVHSGWYTRFHPDACAKGYSLTGERRLLEEARLFWYYGSKRRYRTKHLHGGKRGVGKFAHHVPPKDDDVLSTSRLFYEASHPRADAEPPAAVRDLRVRRLGGGKAEVRFTAPADRGGGRAARYQVKAAALPIAAYEQWDPAKDRGVRRNWWRAANCRGEPAPGKPGAAERFVVTNLPEAAGGTKLYFALRCFDSSSNRSAISNVAVAAAP